MPKPLSAAAVAKLKPRRVRCEIRDGGAVGLSLTIQPSGHKSWTMRFRRPNGRPAKLTLGPIDLSGKESSAEPAIGTPLTLAAARWLAGEVHRQRATGRDVVADHFTNRRAAIDQRANTFAAAARDFIDDHARPKTRRWREKARLLGIAYSVDDGTPLLLKDGLAARWRDKPISEISGHDIYTVTDEARRYGVPGIPATRNPGSSDARGRALALTLSKLFGWLVAHRRITINPSVGVYRPPAPAPRDRVLTTAEIRRLWAACADIGEPFGALVKLLLLTGQRRDEVARMTRAELSDDGATWTLPGSRTKNKRAHVVPLPPLAREVLGEVKQIAGKPGYIFTTNGSTPVSGFSKIKNRLDHAMGEVPPWQLHDLRRTAATGMAELGIAPHIIEAVLNHVSGAKAGVAGVYNRAAYADQKRAALASWAEYVQGLIASESAKIVAIRGLR
jgi:integrase